MALFKAAVWALIFLTNYRSGDRMSVLVLMAEQIVGSLKYIICKEQQLLLVTAL